jgi:tetratricopeptide (TPR) repeat protein
MHVKGGPVLGNLSPPRLAGLALVATWALLGPVQGADLNPDLARYHEIVSRYRSGDVDGAARSIAAWDGQRLLNAARDVWRLKQRKQELSGWDAKSLASACLLHLDVLVRVPDRRRFGALQVQILRVHLAGLRRLHGLSSITAELHLGLALYMQGQLLLEDLQAFFDEVGNGVPHPGLLLAEGTLHEVLASRRLDMARRVRLIPSRAKSLEKAEGLLRQALAAAPDLTEARLRLAHVVALQGRPDEVTALLQVVLEGSTHADERYLASLFLGRAYAAVGQLEAARNAYAVAATECPCGQAAAVALAHAAFVERRFEAAREILANPLRPSAGCTDPWTSYDFGQAPRLPSLITELRQALRQ